MSEETTGQVDTTDQRDQSDNAARKVTRTRKTKPAPSDDDLRPIKLIKNYRPFGKDPNGWGDFLIERDGDLVEPGVNDEGLYDRDKVKAGTIIHVPLEEARRALKEGIAERADEL